MSRSAVSIFIFGIYLAILGVLLVAIPNVLLGLMRIPPSHEVWIRLAGMLLLILAFFYIQAARNNLAIFFRWTSYTRLSALFFVIAFVLSGLIGPIIGLLWLEDLAGAIWTGLALRSERQP
jgi:Kef-type K+ transport system membrane component KefB